MRIVVISNDVTPGFGVPVAAPGLRAAGLAAGLRSHGHDVTVAVPADLLQQLGTADLSTPPEHQQVVHPADLMSFVDSTRAEVVVFINPNLSPQLSARDGVHFVYDLFAPKVLERQASAQLAATTEELAELSAIKVRALALADSVWVNGRRKVPYALDWIERPEVNTIRQAEFGKPARSESDVARLITVVEMPIALPDHISPLRPARDTSAGLRVGIAGYAQAWSTIDAVHVGHQMIIDAGHELHALLPKHWGGGSQTAPTDSVLPARTHRHSGPLEFPEFSSWVQSMDAMVDVFAPSDERRLAMITRSAVALRLGVPLIHAVDSEISDIIIEHDAGWVVDPNDAEQWTAVLDELQDPQVLERKTNGAVTASTERFAPEAALGSASSHLSAHRASTNAPDTIDILIPFWGLAGGVIKILDYAEHAANLGIDTTLWAPPIPEASDLIHTIPVTQRLLANDRITIRLLDELELHANSTVLFTEPTHHPLIERASPAHLGERLIHLVQGTRHANPNWNDGLNYRLLHRPMTRIAVTEQVASAIGPIAEPTHPVHTIVEGHDCSYFSGRPLASSSPKKLRVLYNTWKSDLGDRIAAALADDDSFAFIAIRRSIGWPELRNRYHGADIMLCTPGPEEGFYLPGLEAMAAGAVVVSSIVGGNAAYISPNENALVAPYDDVEMHIAALHTLRGDAELRRRLAKNGERTSRLHNLDSERTAFGHVLDTVVGAKP